MNKDAKKMVEMLEKNPIVKKIIEENADAVREERLAAAARLRSAVDEAERIIPALQRRVDSLASDLAEYDAGRAAFLDKLTSARAGLMAERLRLDRELSDAEAALLSNYDERIDAGIEFFRDRFEDLLTKDVHIQRHTGQTNPFLETKEIFTFSNVAALENALIYCQTAIRELEEMKLKPTSDLDRISSLKREIPDPDQLAETAGERPLPGSRGVNPLYLFPSDGEQAWRMERLTEKFQKLMGR